MGYFEEALWVEQVLELKVSTEQAWFLVKSGRLLDLVPAWVVVLAGTMRRRDQAQERLRFEA